MAPEIFDPGDLLGELARRHGVDLILTVAPGGAGAVRGDAAKLRGVLSDLLRHAVDLSPPGGRVRVEAQVAPGAGAALTVRCEITGTGAVVSLDLAFARADAAPARAHVLVVDDDAINQKVAVRLLETLGCRVDVAGDGEEALRALTVRAYDAVFMDCQMPVVDGYEATRRIRQEGLVKDPHVPVIAMTAQAMAGDREKCLAAGMDDYVTKPVSRDAVAQALERALRRRRRVA